ncbi:pyridoxamine 5'-phosphate oxidase family protein [Defluviimonas sp. WL0002]|uniref:Pyridoxamine 5'-phosphate oxidase family protein n=1 Tax=Albidovulum marisflavi TaxID=2984159 RepID=A0ABT2Z9W1_9RHOB|nr:pyridoxamine 5'-phosphate oxidase family protein [Defluviimonas sp. WL0002]MCV2867923.1 pyridoxamine 5'-phosphate oxidase family protein [Defluviimonas sp. WL0002]
MTDKPSPIRETDDEARELAQELMRSARFAALGVLHPDTGTPHVTRVGFGLAPDGAPVTLISDLSVHTRALAADPRASLLVGEPGSRGDPLTHPRLTLSVRARFVDRQAPEHSAIRARWLSDHPKSGLYADFADFHFVVFEIESAALNAGFGKAFLLLRTDFAAG